MTQAPNICAVVVPRWGLTMDEAMIATWRVAEGAAVSAGDELLDIETSKIANAVEAPCAGILRVHVGKPGETYACGALIGVIADSSATDDEVAAFVAAHVPAPTQARQEPNEAFPQTLQVKGRALSYLIQGSGEVPVLLIHGLGGDLNNWMFVQRPLSSGRSVIALDLPGHGRSNKDLSGIKSFADLADLIGTFLDELAVGQVHVVAHSMGALVALGLLREHPKRVKSATLLSPVGLGPTPSQRFLTDLLLARTRQQAGTLLKMLIADEKQVSRRMVNDLLKYKRLDGVEPALRQFLDLMNKEPIVTGDTLARVTSPIHAIWGSDDRIVPPPSFDQLASNVKLTVLNGVGHMPHLEQASAVLAAIERVCAQ